MKHLSYYNAVNVRTEEVSGIYDHYSINSWYVDSVIINVSKVGAKEHKIQTLGCEYVTHR